MGPTVYAVAPQTTVAAPGALGGWMLPYPAHEPAHMHIQNVYMPEVAGTPLQPITTLGTLPATSQPSSNSPPVNYPLSVTMCMEVVWHGEFQRLFHNFLHFHNNDWQLTPVTNVPTDADQYKLFQDSAKVRFFCEDCGRGWTSMKGRVAFWFRLDHVTNTGEVMFKLFGQQCQRCTGNGKDKFHHAMWYPEEVVKVVQNLYNRVGTTYYGFQLPPIRIDRRTGKPRAQHDSKLCQACKDGICREGWMLN